MEQPEQRAGFARRCEYVGKQGGANMRHAWLVTALLLAVAAGAAAAVESSPTADTYGPLSLYAEAMGIVHQLYVDDVPWSKLVGDGVAGMVETLDGDSVLLGPERTREIATGVRPSGDVGIAVARRSSGLVVVAVRDGSPAQAAGMRSGDAVVSIDGGSTARASRVEAAARLRGAPGTEVSISVVRTGWAEPVVLTLKREMSPANHVSDRALGDGIHYVRIPELGATTASELEQILVRLPEPGASGLVLDLRNTAGGQVSAAASVVGLFLAGRVVAHVESRAATTPADLLAPESAAGHQGQPIAVLVNHGTESAAEVLAGALQDWGRAVIVGTATFGDASAQSLISLPGERTLELTTARYLTPKGRAITGKGIVPDVPATPAERAGLDATLAAPQPGSPDPEVQLAFEMVKAARIGLRGL